MKINNKIRYQIISAFNIECLENFVNGYIKRIQKYPWHFGESIRAYPFSSNTIDVSVQVAYFNEECDDEECEYYDRENYEHYMIEIYINAKVPKEILIEYYQAIRPKDETFTFTESEKEELTNLKKSLLDAGEIKYCLCHDCDKYIKEGEYCSRHIEYIKFEEEFECIICKTSDRDLWHQYNCCGVLIHAKCLEEYKHKTCFCTNMKCPQRCSNENLHVKINIL
jgi:hypothetical protein